MGASDTGPAVPGDSSSGDPGPAVPGDSPSGDPGPALRGDSPSGDPGPALRGGPASRAAKLARIVTLLVPVLVAAACAVSGYKVFDRNRVMFDDAFITYRYADNLANGYGAVYNVGERVEGYTNFLWMLFAATGIKLGLDPLQVTRALGVTSHLLMLALIGWALASWLLEGERGLADPKRALSLFLLPALSVTIAPQSFSAMAGSGLQSPFGAFLGTARRRVARVRAA